MTPPHGYTEDALVEQPSIKLFESLGWQTINAYEEILGPQGTLGREAQSDIVLPIRLRKALEALNPELPKEAIDQAFQELARDRTSVSMAEANRELHLLLKEGVRVRIRDKSGERFEKVRTIDWDNPKKNDFLLVSQLWVTGDVYKRRCDLVGFVNGLPLVFIELKASHKRLEHAFEHNLRDYKNTIPQLFRYNSFIILSNAQKAKIGTLTAGWDHYAEWKKITSEGERGIVSLETLVRGTCEPSRLLDIIENFVAFSQERGTHIKILTKNHQYLGVNNSIAALKDVKRNKGQLGVFWHTQGSGKSYSMLFFTQKVLRKVPGNFTFVIVTDRMELDDQIYGTFDKAGVVTEKRMQATDGEHLKQLLKEDHRLVFTLIQKFRTEKGKQYPRLSDRSDVIVITDEAHRTQYDVLALNMRNALPSAGFLGFTGTPLMAGEEKTRQVFGDYVSVYNFRQSVEDGATVQLYYENRIPELQLTNPKLTEGMAEIVESADLDETQEKKIAREFEREYHLITRDDRLTKIAGDLVEHFSGRGYLGKGMVVSIDKETAVRMYDKVKLAWGRQLGELRKKAAKAVDPEKTELEARIKFMAETGMAVVVSQAQNEVEDFKKKGLDILTHRRRMISEDLEEKFKDPKDRLRLVFVCAMWITGFDVPSMSTIYVDKPMRNHTLMQTIARANRVFGDKQNGLIVDYIGVFRDLQKALAIYGSAAGGGIAEGEMPVKSKTALVAGLREAVQEAEAFCDELGIDLDRIDETGGFERVGLIRDAVDAIFISDETRRRFFTAVGRVEKIFKAVLPDASANEFAPKRNALKVIAEGIRSEIPEADISEIVADIEALLDRSIATEGYAIGHASEKRKLVDLSKIDLQALQKRFAKGRKHTEAERLRAILSQRVARVVRANPTRADYLEKFQELIDEYNAGSLNIEALFAELVTFSRGLDDEEQRGIRAGLDEEELVIFDILTKPNLKLTGKEEAEVKKVAKSLLESLKNGKLALDWRKRQQTRAQVLVTIQDRLEQVPPKFDSRLYEAKCALVYQHVFDSYFGPGQSVYTGSPR